MVQGSLCIVSSHCQNTRVISVPESKNGSYLHSHTWYGEQHVIASDHQM